MPEFELHFNGVKYDKSKSYKSIQSAKAAVTVFSRNLATSDYKKDNRISDGASFMTERIKEYKGKFSIHEIRSDITICPHCTSEMVHVVLHKESFEVLDPDVLHVDGTASHIYDCINCPAILVEWLDSKDTMALSRYTSNDK